MSRKLLAGALAVLAVGGIGAGSAVAGQITSTVTIREAADHSALQGKVRSERRRCKVNRRVALFWDAPGGPREFVRVRTDETDNRGRWRVPAPGVEIPPGRYFAKAVRKGDCKPARSQVIRVLAP